MARRSSRYRLNDRRFGSQDRLIVVGRYDRGFGPIDGRLNPVIGVQFIDFSKSETAGDPALTTVDVPEGTEVIFAQVIDSMRSATSPTVVDYNMTVGGESMTTLAVSSPAGGFNVTSVTTHLDNTGPALVGSQPVSFDRVTPDGCCHVVFWFLRAVDTNPANYAGLPQSGLNESSNTALVTPLTDNGLLLTHGGSRRPGTGPKTSPLVVTGDMVKLGESASPDPLSTSNNSLYTTYGSSFTDDLLQKQVTIDWGFADRWAQCTCWIPVTTDLSGFSDGFNDGFGGS